jgi:hypothetical protein
MSFKMYERTHDLPLERGPKKEISKRKRRI